MNAPELVAHLQQLVAHDDERPVVVSIGPELPYDVVGVERYEDAVVLKVERL